MLVLLTLFGSFWGMSSVFIHIIFEFINVVLNFDELMV